MLHFFKSSALESEEPGMSFLKFDSKACRIHKGSRVAAY
jgi:hypothetical protein